MHNCNGVELGMNTWEGTEMWVCSYVIPKVVQLKPVSSLIYNNWLLGANGCLIVGLEVNQGLSIHSKLPSGCQLGSPQTMAKALQTRYPPATVTSWLESRARQGLELWPELDWGHYNLCRQNFDLRPIFLHKYPSYMRWFQDCRRYYIILYIYSYPKQTY